MRDSLGSQEISIHLGRGVGIFAAIVKITCLDELGFPARPGHCGDGDTSFRIMNIAGFTTVGSYNSNHAPRIVVLINGGLRIRASIAFCRGKQQFPGDMGEVFFGDD